MATLVLHRMRRIFLTSQIHAIVFSSTLHSGKFPDRAFAPCVSMVSPTTGRSHQKLVLSGPLVVSTCSVRDFLLSGLSYSPSSVPTGSCVCVLLVFVSNALLASIFISSFILFPSSIVDESWSPFRSALTSPSLFNVVQHPLSHMVVLSPFAPVPVNSGTKCSENLS